MPPIHIAHSTLFGGTFYTNHRTIIFIKKFHSSLWNKTLAIVADHIDSNRVV
jgi:hypothetical protein